MTVQQLTTKGKWGASIATVNALGVGSLSLLPRLTLSPVQRSALVGMKDACELAHYLPHVPRVPTEREGGV